MLLFIRKMKTCHSIEDGLNRELISASCCIRVLWKKSSMALMSLCGICQY